MSKEPLMEAYKLINIKCPSGILLSPTIGKEHEWLGKYLTYEYLNEGNRPLDRPLDITPYVDFDTLLTLSQKTEMIKHFENWPSVRLDSSLTTANLKSEEEEVTALIEEGQSFAYTHLSFPIIQEGKHGIRMPLLLKGNF